MKHIRLFEDYTTKSNCEGFRYDPTKSFYDDENEYNCAVKYWEDAVNLRKAYLFQKQNCNWRQHIKNMVKTLNDMGTPTTFEGLLKERTRNMGVKPGDLVKIKGDTWGRGYYRALLRNPNPENKDHMDASLGDYKIYNHYKSLKFNFPVAIGIYSSPDLIHRDLRPQGTYFDGIATSPYYADPGPKPTLLDKTTGPLKTQGIPKPIEPVKPPIESPAQDWTQRDSGENSVFGPSKSLIGFMRGRDFVPVTGQHAVGMNKADRDLLNDKNALNQYIQILYGAYANPIK